MLVLFEMEELSAAEIAELLDAKVSTVRVWLFRARAASWPSSTSSSSATTMSRRMNLESPATL